jgi:hypothetical protein
MVQKLPGTLRINNGRNLAIGVDGKKLRIELLPFEYVHRVCASYSSPISSSAILICCINQVTP